jgi:hypothetical protein
MKKTVNSRNMKVAQISEEFSRSKLPGQAAALSIPGGDAAVAMFSRPLADLIKGGMAGARSTQEREAYPGLRALVKRYMPWLPEDFAEKLKLPAFYYLEHYMAKVTRDPATGQEVLFVILAREKNPKTKEEVYTIFDLTNQQIKRVDDNDPLFEHAKTIHVNAEEARLQHLNSLASAHDQFMERLNANPNAGGVTAWCSMLVKAIRVADERLAVLGAQKHAAENREPGLRQRMDAEQSARVGEGDEFQKALTSPSFFEGAESVIVHILESHGEASKMDELARSIRAGALSFPHLVDNLSRQMPRDQAEQIVDGMMKFIADIADRIKEKYDQDAVTEKTRQTKIENPQVGGGDRPNIPESIGQFTMEEMPAWVHGRLQSYTKMTEYTAQGRAMSISLNVEIKALTILRDNMQLIQTHVCKDTNFPKNRAALLGNPAAIQDVSNAKQAMLDYFQKYSSAMFVEDKESGEMRIDKRKIGSGNSNQAVANLELGIYLIHMSNKLDAMGF